MGTCVKRKELQRRKWTLSFNKTKQKLIPTPGIVFDSSHSQSQTTDSKMRGKKRDIQATLTKSLSGGAVLSSWLKAQGPDTA